MTVATGVAEVGAWLGENSSAVHWGKEIAPDSPAAVPALRQLLGLLDQLDVPETLADVSGLLAREGEINGLGARMQASAQQRVRDARQAALTADDPEAALEDLGYALTAVEQWTPAGPGRDSLLMGEARTLAKAAVQRAVMVTSGRGDATYRVLQDLAAESVRVVSEAPLPDKVWSTAEPAAAVVSSPDPGSWTAMMLHTDRLRKIHEAAVMVRAIGGVQTELPGAAPASLAWLYRNWQAAETGFESLRRIARPLRLRWAVEQGWDPGLWRADQIDGNPFPVKRAG